MPRVDANRILIFLPNWVGDAVMATPFLMALRGLYPGAEIHAAGRPLVVPVVEGLELADGVPVISRFFVVEKKQQKALIRALKAEKYDLAILLPNSFRAAWLAWRVGARARLGYARGGRSLLLTHRLTPKLRTAEQKRLDAGKAAAIQAAGGKRVAIGSAYEPVPAIDYYLEMARYLGNGGAESQDKSMRLGVTPAQQRAGEEILAAANPERRPVAVMVPGANFGSSKCWMPERFAEVADVLADPAGAYGAVVLLAATGAEKPIVEAILAAAKHKQRIVALNTTLGAIKQLVRVSRLMVCNDTGPRHFAAAFGVPCVTLFGPTDPVWAHTYAANERLVKVDVACGPCQLKRCPIDHGCMKGISASMVVAAIGELWRGEEDSTTKNRSGEDARSIESGSANS